MYVGSNFSTKPDCVYLCTRQELCLSDDTTTRFGFFTIDVDVNGSRRTWCDDGLKCKYEYSVMYLLVLLILCLGAALLFTKSTQCQYSCEVLIKIEDNSNDFI